MLYTCKFCLVEMPRTLDFFYAHTGMRDGMLKWCKACHREQAKKRDLADPAKALQRRKDVYAKRADVAKAEAKRWYQANEDRAKAVRRRWASQNAEVKKAADKKYSALNAEKIRAKNAEWVEKNPERAKENDRRKYYQRIDHYRGLSRQSAARRRAKKLSAGGSHTRAEFLALLEAEGGRCRYCQCDITPATAEADHIVPISKGGSDGIENIAPSCALCNRRKGSYSLEEFLARNLRRA